MQPHSCFNYHNLKEVLRGAIVVVIIIKLCKYLGFDGSKGNDEVRCVMPHPGAFLKSHLQRHKMV